MDDESTVCQAVAMILKSEHHRTTVFTDPREAAKYVETNDFDIAFVDLKMPHVPGSEIVNQIRSKHPSVPVVIVAARSISPVDISADRVLLKPFSSEELRRAVSELVGTRSSRTSPNSSCQQAGKT